MISTSYLGGVPMRHVATRDHATGLLITEIAKADISRLEEYSGTPPTSPSVGRVWKRKLPDNGWVLGYCYGHNDRHCLLAWRRLVVVDELRRVHD